MMIVIVAVCIILSFLCLLINKPLHIFASTYTFFVIDNLYYEYD